MLLPVRLVQRIDAHRFATTRGVDEAVVAQVDGNVVDSTALDVEENQIARLQILALDFLAVAAGHGVGGAWQIHRFYIVKGIFHQTTAVEPFTWAAAAPTIRCTEDVYRTAQHIAAFLVRHRRDKLVVGFAQRSRWLGRDGDDRRRGAAHLWQAPDGPAILMGRYLL